MREGEAVFKSCFVKICEVDADPPFAILLLDDDWICQQLGILHFRDGARVQQSVDLFIDCL